MAVSNAKGDGLLVVIDDDDAIVDYRRLDSDEESPLLELNEVDDPDFGWSKVERPEPWYKRPSVFWLLIPFAFSALAHGGVIVPKVNLVLALICHDYFKKHTLSSGVGLDFHSSAMSFEPGEKCRIPAVQSETATFKLVISVITGSFAAIIAPKLGALSDRYGRVRMLAFINCGMIIHEIVAILAAKFPDIVSVYWILVGAVFDGMTGSFISSMAISQSYVSDCTPSNRRSVVFGWFHGCLFTGIALGPILAGYIIKQTGSIISMFYLATGCHIVFLLLLLFAVPESVPKAQQLAAREKDRRVARPAQNLLRSVIGFRLLEPLKIIYGTGASPSLRRNLILLAATDTIVSGFAMGANQVVLLYSNYIFGWDQWSQAKFTSIVNSCRVTCLLLVLPAVTLYYRKRQRRRISIHQLSPREPQFPEGSDRFELSVIRFAIVADILGFLGYAMAPSGTQFIISGAIASVGGIGSPTMQAALTKHVAKECVGQLLGAMGLLHALARVFGPMVFTGLYAGTVYWFPQAYFWVLAAMFASGLLFSCFIEPALDSSALDRRLD